MVETSGFTRIRRVAPIALETHGGRAKCLQRLIRLDLPVPQTVALSFDAVHRIAMGELPDLASLLAVFGSLPLVSLRRSTLDSDWGGPGAILNIGMNHQTCAALGATLGEDVAMRLYLGFVQGFAVNVARLDPELFEMNKGSVAENLRAALRAFEEETETPFPQDPAEQLAEALRSMARAWESTSARLLRQARGAPPDAGLGLVVQRMALGVAPGVSGSGVIQFADSADGTAAIRGRFLAGALHNRDIDPKSPSMALTHDDAAEGQATGEPSLAEVAPEMFAALCGHGTLCRARLREEMQIEFTVESGRLAILDSVPIARSPRAGMRIAVELAQAGILTPDEAVLRVEPTALGDLLHRHVDPAGARSVIVRGIAASPGAAVGQLVFTAADAQAVAARGEACILVRRETTPEDIRGMQSARAVLTERGGITSHAAVIARGLGLPCIVGASNIRLNIKEKTINTADGKVLRQGDVVTLDGSAGEVLGGEVRLLEPSLDDAFRTLMGWADKARDIGVRANAETLAEARVARNFAAEGIGLCRTEHMFFQEDRLVVMREMIFADSAVGRAAALERLLPMQRADFVALFRIMEGLPVCIRLFDPPLHEFLPSDREGMRELSEALAMPLSDVQRRIADLTEVNPMLGMRGVRLGITVPEIYDMQARAIFEATIEASRGGAPVVPEVMIPLVSARREVELVKTRIDAVAAAVQSRTGASFDYRLGVMVETPRAALRAEEIAHSAAFLSFGTNDLTQMTYGLSRDDAGRFMRDYVNKGVFAEDPFQFLDREGVGELLRIGAERGRRGRADITLSICGEHGGDPDSIAFCRAAGFNYVSCSPYRVPVARLAAAHIALKKGVSA